LTIKEESIKLTQEKNGELGIMKNC